MQTAGKSLNGIAGLVATTAAAAADIPANQLQYNLGDGSKVALFGDAISDPGDIAEKFGVFHATLQRRKVLYFSAWLEPVEARGSSGADHLLLRGNQGCET